MGEAGSETVRSHLSHLKPFLHKLPNTFTLQDLKRSLKAIPNQNTRSNKAKALRRFLRDYAKLISQDEAREIEIEQPPINFGPIPSDEDMMAFGYALSEGSYARIFYLIVASSGLRRVEALSLRWKNVNSDLIIPKAHNSDKTKRSYFTFINSEAMEALESLKAQVNPKEDDPIFPKGDKWLRVAFDKAQAITGIKITPQVIRRWHADKLDRLGVREKYIEFFQGKTPKTTLRRHYSDYNVDRLKRVYDEAGLRVLG